MTAARRTVLRWRTLAGLALLALATSVQAAEALVLAVSRGPVSLPVYVAQAKGYFEGAGLTVRVSDCSSGRHCLELMMQGQAQVATAAELAVTLASFNRQDLAIIGTTSTSSHQIKLVARGSSGVQRPADLKGRRVAYVAASSSQYFLDTWGTFHGIDPKDMTRLPLEPDRMVEALKERRVDALAVWEPHASNAIEVLGADAVVLPNPRVYTQHFNVVTDRVQLQGRGAEMTALLQALLKAERFIAERPAEAAALLQARLQIDAAAAAAQLKEHDYRIRLDQSLISTMEEQARWAIREKLVDARQRPASLLQAIEPSLLRRASPRAVSLVQ
ncbi:NrtA/SsuA/CpmA family ABC transporter substrate-binding protein [Rhizobacter sp. J219]|uniref:ABC transporter substrate-binding protein n=1 Tax=Rhizobacter sp. J219 TaxID=2898430 RepID=UPI00215159E9|nr:NrtA/SsuA/CpmA family ABC transporter substrate-binding protein [Rhizobacter sp. J219]MCR5885092.1 NrtA/SsuA/CpmA family ABC transporter substrate-binding protein [Rhizobacter sp. J219]